MMMSTYRGGGGIMHHQSGGSGNSVPMSSSGGYGAASQAYAIELSPMAHGTYSPGFDSNSNSGYSYVGPDGDQYASGSNQLTALRVQPPNESLAGATSSPLTESSSPASESSPSSGGGGGQEYDYPAQYGQASTSPSSYSDQQRSRSPEATTFLLPEEKRRRRRRRK